MNDISTTAHFKIPQNISTEEYFENNEFSIDAFNKKYKLDDLNETYTDALKRVCNFVASVEKTKELQEYWANRWFNEIYDDWWHPAGSIMQGAGSGKKISLANCTTISMGNIDNKNEWDNLESIIKNTAFNVAKTAAYRQGLGVDFSKLRPKKMKVHNSSNESEGVIHWMKFIDSIGYYVGQKGRIPAMLFSLSIKHPDVMDFIGIKSDYTKIQNANISVQITNNFYRAVENDKEWTMKFEMPEIKKGDKIYLDVHSTDIECQKDENGWYKIATHDNKKEVIQIKKSAREILKLIAKNMMNHAEPGIQNIDIAKKYSNSDYVYDSILEYDTRIQSTNACSEQYLSRESLCVLASLNVEKFSTNSEKYKEELIIIGESITRFLDNVNECELMYNTAATIHQKLAIQYLRRIGAGITNIGGWLFKLNLEYGSEEANDKIEDFVKWYNYNLYKTSIKLGKEKGSFKAFNKEKFILSPFVKRMIKTFPDLTFDTMRNVTCSSIAPTGTLSLMFRNMVMSYGIEPAFNLYYWKRTRIAGKYDYYFIVPRIVRQVYKEAGYEIPINSDSIKDTWDGSRGKEIVKFMEEHYDKIGIKFINSTEVNPYKKLDLMAKVMKWIDSSISVTYMLPEDSNEEDIYNFIIEAYKKEVKSIAAFPDKKLYGIVSFIPFKELARKLLDENIEIHPQNFSEDELKELHLSNEFIIASDAPKRPKILDADIYIVSVKGLKFIIIIGKVNGAPYEIFGGHTNGFTFKFNYRKGAVEKIKRRVYKLYIDPEIEIEDFTKYFTPVEQAMFRLVSTSLRHGVSIKFIVDQLNKSTEDLTSFASATSRVLKKYIKDGEIITGKACPMCSNTSLVYKDGCISCSCGWSKCD